MSIQDTVWKRNIEYAGGWFVGEYMGLVLDNFNELENNKEFKNEFVKDIFSRRGRGEDSGGTRIRVDAVLRIIKSNKEVGALEYIINSSTINNKEPKAVSIAKETLKKIEFPQ